MISPDSHEHEKSVQSECNQKNQLNQRFKIIQS